MLVTGAHLVSPLKWRIAAWRRRAAEALQDAPSAAGDNASCHDITNTWLMHCKVTCGGTMTFRGDLTHRAQAASPARQCTEGSRRPGAVRWVDVISARRRRRHARAAASRPAAEIDGHRMLLGQLEQRRLATTPQSGHAGAGECHIDAAVGLNHRPANSLFDRRWAKGFHVHAVNPHTQVSRPRVTKPIIAGGPQT